MKLTINPLNLRMTRAVALFVDARVRAGLGRLAGGAEVIRVTLRRERRGEAEIKDCRVQVLLAGMPPIVTKARDRDLYAAISSACLRAGAVARRAQQLRHRPPVTQRPRLQLGTG